ncbi:hypothetical protein ACQEVZ_39845 [Dactylosporangium sp. CA-152071]|uniref:hypothetical protein n=1 Tax=Dactylosporangium sp. CA-152071 TaxID=3239933 RepID=UPI003D9432F1
MLGGRRRRVIAGTAAAAALLLGGVASVQFGGAQAAPDVDNRGLTGREVDAVLVAASSCPALTPARLAAQLVADRGAVSVEVWNRWAPWPAANRADPNAGVQALAHHMCQLIGELRVAGVSGDLWPGALAAHRVGSGQVRLTNGVPAGSATEYVDTVGRYAQWYAAQSQLRTGPPLSLSALAGGAARPSAPTASSTAKASASAGPKPSKTAGPVPTVKPTTAGPGRVDCTKSTKVGDVTFEVCWTWDWVTGTSIWRPRTMRFTTTDASKTVTITISTGNVTTPAGVGFGNVNGNSSWTVPIEFDWNMTAGAELTTTTIVRRVPGRATDCTARVRHQPDKPFVLEVVGSC